MGRTDAATLARAQRASLKRMIKDGTVDGADVVAGIGNHEDVAVQMPALDLVKAVPSIGPQTAVVIMRQLGIPTDVRMFALTDDRRRQLAGEIRKRVS